MTKSDKIVFIYITAASEKEAVRISKAVLKKGLAACSNILAKMRSHYWWKGKLESSNECVLIFKTRKSYLPRVTEEVKKLHSYEVPCILSFEVKPGNEDYVRWLLNETKRHE